MTTREFELMVNANHRRRQERELDQDVQQLRCIINEDTTGADRAQLIRAWKIRDIQRAILAVMSALVAGTALAVIAVSILGG